MNLMERGGGALCCAGAGIESREAGMFERLSGQRARLCTGLEVGTALGFRAVRYVSEGGSGPGRHEGCYGSQQRLHRTDT